MLIQNAEIWGHGLADLRIANGRITQIGQLKAQPHEPTLNAQYCALIPGLHDHHIHLAALAVRHASIVCGPPEISDEAGLSARLTSHLGDGWMRGIAYHESVMGLPCAAQLDQIIAHRPLRIQHRSGRMWLLNSLALAQLLKRASPPPGLERENDKYTGRLFDEDAWLQRALASTPPPFAVVSKQLSAYGITGLTDMSPRNDPAIAAHFTTEIASNALQQRVILAGTLALATASSGAWQCGPAKLHLHENALPDLDETMQFIASAHAQNRGVAVHCTSEVEMIFALAALQSAGTSAKDRIEHAGITTDAMLDDIARLGLSVVSQPHFIAEKGDAYLRDVEPCHHAALYRLASFAHAGVPLAAGSDAPFASADPWASIAAAISRQTPSGAIIGADEALSPEAALALYLADPMELARQRRIYIGAPADLCLLNQPWHIARNALNSNLVRATIMGGNCVYQAPI